MHRKLRRKRQIEDGVESDGSSDDDAAGGSGRGHSADAPAAKRRAKDRASADADGAGSDSGGEDGGAAKGGAGGGDGVGHADSTLAVVEGKKAVAAIGRGFGDVKYINRQRVLIFSGRGIGARYRHLMDDLRALVPHHKKEAKLDSKDRLSTINEVAEIKGCNTTVFFEVRKKKDLFLWVSKTPNGPSVKFHVLNVHTMDELRMSGNCLKGSRPFLSFDKRFTSAPRLRLIREMLTQVFGTPRGHPKSQPFNDHVMAFHIADDKIWFRHYQIVDVTSEGLDPKVVHRAGGSPVTLVEIGPRFVMDIVRVFKGSFGGPTLYTNANFVTPNKLRAQEKVAYAQRYRARQSEQTLRRERFAAMEEERRKDVLKTVFAE